MTTQVYDIEVSRTERACFTVEADSEAEAEAQASELIEADAIEYHFVDDPTIESIEENDETDDDDLAEADHVADLLSEHAEDLHRDDPDTDCPRCDDGQVA